MKHKLTIFSVDQNQHYNNIVILPQPHLSKLLMGAKRRIQLLPINDSSQSY